MNDFFIEGRGIGEGFPVYFIADLAANHDGDLGRAKELIWLAAEAGAHAAKFQHFKADTIVSDYGFKRLGGQVSHQKAWKKSVYDVYADASLNENWTLELKDTCKSAGVAFLTSPYSKELVDYVDEFVEAYKIGSGDITWLEIIDYICDKNKPILLATGASNLSDVSRAMDVILKKEQRVVLMQCNTNYTASHENFKHINLNVLKTFRQNYPDVILGLSDHTLGHSTVLGAVTLGAKVIEKHFTDDCNRSGPDHKFSMSPSSWKEMVQYTQELELALGEGLKKVEDNESETVVLQRRALRAKSDLYQGDLVQGKDFIPLRPCPEDALRPDQKEEILGMRLTKNISKGDIVKWSDLTSE